MAGIQTYPPSSGVRAIAIVTGSYMTGSTTNWTITPNLANYLNAVVTYIGTDHIEAGQPYAEITSNSNMRIINSNSSGTTILFYAYITEYTSVG